MLRKPVVISFLVVLLLGGIGGAVFHHKVLRWKRFAIVEPGVLYRSGILKDWQLRQAIRQYGIKTVYSLTFTNNTNEEIVCQQEGAAHYFQYLPGDGVGTNDPYLRFLEIMQNPANHPVLVHCSAGVQRTGGAVALFRLFQQGWHFDDAIKEMIDMGNEGTQAQISQLRRIHEDLAWPTSMATEKQKVGVN